MLLTGSREELWADARATHQVAQRYIELGRIDLPYPWPLGTARAPDGKYYSPYGVLPSLVHLPGAWIDYKVGWNWPALLPLVRPLTGHFPSAVAGALTCTLLLGLCLRLGASRAVATTTAIV